MRLKASHSFSSLGSPLLLVYSRRSLVSALAAREVRDRYAGSILGLAWAVFQPLALVAVLVTVFGFAGGGKVAAGAGANGVDYVAYAVAGFLPWLAISSGLQAAAVSVRAQPALVKQIDFPLEVLPLKSVLANTVGQLAGTILLLAYLYFRTGSWPPTLALAIPAFLLQAALTVGLGWIAATLTTYVRDTEHVLSTLLVLNLYLMPVFFIDGMLPGWLQTIIDLNPMSSVIRVFQDIFVFGQVRSIVSWIVFGTLALASFELGFRFFRRASPGFGNLI